MKSTPMFAAVAGLEAVVAIALVSASHVTLAICFTALTLFTGLAAAAAHSRGA